MILGRPTGQWLGLVTLISGAIASTAILLGVDAKLVGGLVAPWTAVLGGIITLIASQPPVVNPGDTVHVTTPSGQPTYVTTIAQPPAQDPPPVPAGGGS